MFLHLGEETVILKKDIIMISDMDGVTISRFSRELLRKGEVDGNIITVSSLLPKSIIITSDNKIYLSPISLSTLLKKSNL